MLEVSQDAFEEYNKCMILRKKCVLGLKFCRPVDLSCFLALIVTGDDGLAEWWSCRGISNDPQESQTSISLSIMNTY
jgi:hypothetical protein